MTPVAAQAGPDTGLPSSIEAVLAVLFYAGPLVFAALAVWAWHDRRPGWSIGALAFLAASIYTEAAFLDLACSPGEDGCEWIEDMLPVAAAAAALVLVAAGLLAAGRSRIATVSAAIGTGLGLWVTLGYLAQVA